MHQDEAPDDRVELLVGGELEQVGLDEAEPIVAGAGSAGGCRRERGRRVVDADNLSGRADHLGRDHGDIAHAAADVEHAHAGLDAGAPQPVARFDAEDLGLAFEPGELMFGVAKNIWSRIAVAAHAAKSSRSPFAGREPGLHQRP